jgi:mercuric ion transport protein
MKTTHAASMDTTKNADSINAKQKRTGLAAAGALLSAVAASSCCIVPLALFGLGVGGAWIGNLTALAPYQPVFVALAIAFLGYGFYAVYWRPKPACADGATCDQPISSRIVKTGLWMAAAMIATALAFPYVAPRLLGV